MLKVFCGRPHNLCGLSPDEVKVYNFLDGLGIEYARVEHAPADCDGVRREIDLALAPAVACKNLFLTNSKGDAFFLLVMRADKHFTGRTVARQIDSTRLSFAPAEALKRYLNGVPGSVSVMNLINDCEGRVELLADIDVYTAEYMRCHPCANTASLRLSSADVFGRFAPATRHKVRAVRI